MVPGMGLGSVPHLPVIHRFLHDSPLSAAFLHCPFLVNPFLGHRFPNLRWGLFPVIVPLRWAILLAILRQLLRPILGTVGSPLVLDSPP